MDDLIVIILTLIVLVAGAFGQTKKKKQQLPVAGQSQKPGDFWDLFDEKPQPQISSSVFPVTTESEEDNPTGREEKHDYGFSSQDEGGTIFSTGKTIVEPVRETKHPQSRFTFDKFSLRDAVVYSEILNRKYI